MSASNARNGRRILVLYWSDPFRPIRAAIRQHLRLFEASLEKHSVVYCNVALGVPRFVRSASFDVVALHTTLLCARWFPRFADIREQLRWLGDLPGSKIALPQDEYDHAAILDEWLMELGVSLIGTNFDLAHRPILYPRMHNACRFVKILTGYIDIDAADAIARKIRPISERPLDIVYRASHLPYWFGRHGQLKHQIADRTREAACRLDLKTDISTDPNATINSDRWFDFLASGRATIGCESGSSALDVRGEIQSEVRRLLAEQPTMSFAEVSRHLPAGWDDYRFFAIGPRHLEAIITRTCQILIEGEYDGVLRPGEHYLAVRRDMANLGEVLAMVRDAALLEKITERAYEQIYLTGRLTYAAAAAAIDRELDELSPQRSSSNWDRFLRLRIRLSTICRLLCRGVRGAFRRVRRTVFGRTAGAKAHTSIASNVG